MKNDEIQQGNSVIDLENAEIKIEKDLPLNSDIFRMLGTWRNTAVVAVTDRYIFRGWINHVSSERTLDVMNLGSLTEKDRLPEDFLFLVDVECFSLTGKRLRKAANCMLAKSNIYFVGELSGQPLESPDEPHKHPLYQPKRSARVEIMMPELDLQASVHLCDWQQTINVTDTVQRFLPLTSVSLATPLITGESEFAFVAINRNMIVFMTEIQPESGLFIGAQCSSAEISRAQSVGESGETAFAASTLPIVSDCSDRPKKRRNASKKEHKTKYC